jgi:hypothetical protein
LQGVVRKRILPFLRRRRRTARGEGKQEGEDQGEGWLLPAAASQPQSLSSEHLQRILTEQLLDVPAPGNVATPSPLAGLQVVRELGDADSSAADPVVGEVIQLSRDGSMGFLLAHLDTLSATGSASLRLCSGGGQGDKDDSVVVLQPSWFVS